MLIPYTNSRFVEKILVAQDGRSYRVIFLVSYENGQLQARIISTKPLSQPVTLSLAAHCKVCGDITEQIASYVPTVSPYTDLYFFISQPTRAPAFK